jgi:hypothetical protein
MLSNYEAIYEEAHMYLYSKPIICMDTYTLHSFLTTIGVRNRAKLRDIEVAEWGYSSAYKAVNFPAISLLADATKLERIGINVVQWGVSHSTFAFHNVLQNSWRTIYISLNLASVTSRLLEVFIVKLLES